MPALPFLSLQVDCQSEPCDHSFHTTDPAGYSLRPILNNDSLAFELRMHPGLRSIACKIARDF